MKPTGAEKHTTINDNERENRKFQEKRGVRLSPMQKGKTSF